MGPLPTLKDHPRVHPGVLLACPVSLKDIPPFPGQPNPLQHLQVGIIKRIYSLSKASTLFSSPSVHKKKRIYSPLQSSHCNFTSPAAPAPPPASPTFVPGETPNPTAPRAGSPQLPQSNPPRGEKEKKNQEWLCPDVLHNL